MRFVDLDVFVDQKKNIGSDDIFIKYELLYWLQDQSVSCD